MSRDLYTTIADADGHGSYSAQYAAIEKAIVGRFVVIDRNDLPKVVRDEPNGTYLVDGVRHAGRPGPDKYHDRALGDLAMAEHLRANPAIDEEAVRDFARTMWPEATTSDLEYNARLEFARRVIADGWKREVTP